MDDDTLRIVVALAIVAGIGVSLYFLLRKIAPELFEKKTEVTQPTLPTGLPIGRTIGVIEQAPIGSTTETYIPKPIEQGYQREPIRIVDFSINLYH